MPSQNVQGTGQEVCRVKSEVWLIIISDLDTLSTKEIATCGAISKLHLVLRKFLLLRGAVKGTISICFTGCLSIRPVILKVAEQFSSHEMIAPV
jgi:hypothetical protein